MAPQASSLKKSIHAILAWFVAMPALVFWPFISAVPAFKLLAGVDTAGAATLQLAFLATGFWSVFALYIAAEYVRNRNVKLIPALSRN